MKAMEEQSPLMYWFYILPCLFEGLALLTSLSPDAPKTSPLARLPAWLLLFASFVNILSAVVAMRIASRYAERNLLPTAYLRPDAAGRLIYTRGDTVSDLVNGPPEHIKYHTVSLSSDSDNQSSPRGTPEQPPVATTPVAITPEPFTAAAAAV